MQPNPQCNPIENLLSQLKSYVKNYSLDTYDELKDKIKYIFTQATDFFEKNKEK
jgi:hypothetical protein